MVVSWLAPDETVPDTHPDKPLSMTVTNPAIKPGSSIYSILGNTVTLLGRATQEGTATFSVRTDPELVIAITVPDQPTNVTATTGADAQSVITWSAPAIDGGSPITGYRVTSSGGQSCTTTGALTCTVTGLTNGTAYTFTVAAQNARGYSIESAPSLSITPVGVVAPAPAPAPAQTQPPANNLTPPVVEEKKEEAPVDLKEPEKVLDPVVVEVPATPIKTSVDGLSVVTYTGTTNTLLDGKAVEETIRVVNNTQLITESQGIQLQIVAKTFDAKPLAIPSSTQLVVEHEGVAEVAGAGFKPSTSVKVWLFSDPIYLGEFPVDLNGAFNAALQVLKTLPVGEHVLQINGVTTENKIFSQSLPIVIKAKTIPPVVKKKKEVKLIPLPKINAVLFGLSKSTVTFAFTNFEKATLYRIFITNTDSGKLVRAVNASKTRIQLAKLKPKTNYAVRVIAYGADGMEIARMDAPGLTFTTLTTNPVLPKVTIKCVGPKGRLNVKAVRPKCPSGFTQDETFAPLGATIARIGNA